MGSTLFIFKQFQIEDIIHALNLSSCSQNLIFCDLKMLTNEHYRMTN